MRTDLTNFWLAWRETCDVRVCMDEDRVRTACVARPELVEDAKAIAADAVDVVKITNKAMAGWVSNAKKVESLRWAKGNAEEETEVSDEEERSGAESAAEQEMDERSGSSRLSEIEESDDDVSVKCTVVKDGTQRYAKAKRVSEFVEFVESWRKDDLTVTSAFELIQTHLYAGAQRGEVDAEGRAEPSMNGKKLKSYLFEDIGGREGGLSQNLWGYLLKKQMVFVNGRPRPSRLIMAVKDSFKNSVVESVEPAGSPVTVVSPVETERLTVEIDEAADVFRAFLSARWTKLGVKARVALCCALMGYNMCDTFVEQLTETKGKRLSETKNKCVGALFLALKDAGCTAEAVRGLLVAKGQGVLLEFAKKDEACRSLVEHFQVR